MMVANEFLENWCFIINDNIRSLDISKKPCFKTNTTISLLEVKKLLGCLMHRWGSINGSIEDFIYDSNDGKRNDFLGHSKMVISYHRFFGLLSASHPSSLQLKILSNAMIKGFKQAIIGGNTLTIDEVTFPSEVQSLHDVGLYKKVTGKPHAFHFFTDY